MYWVQFKRLNKPSLEICFQTATEKLFECFSYSVHVWFVHQTQYGNNIHYQAQKGRIKTHPNLNIRFLINSQFYFWVTWQQQQSSLQWLQMKPALPTNQDILNALPLIFTNGLFNKELQYLIMMHYYLAFLKITLNYIKYFTLEKMITLKK